jgi:ABC-type uncharacterized transport system auxiliary subunit
MTQTNDLSLSVNALDNESRAIPACAFLILLTLVLVPSIGCSFKQASPAKQSYLLEARRGGEARPTLASAVLRVQTLQVATAFEGKGFVYRSSELGCRTDFYHEFLVAPRALITEQTRQWLGASGLFRNVLDPGSKADATHSLEGNVLALYGDFRSAGSPKAVLAIQFSLVNESAASPAIVFHKSYRQEMPLENRAPETLAKAWGAALEQILRALEEDLAVALTK